MVAFSMVVFHPMEFASPGDVWRPCRRRLPIPHLGLLPGISGKPSLSTQVSSGAGQRLMESPVIIDVLEGDWSPTIANILTISLVYSTFNNPLTKSSYFQLQSLNGTNWWARCSSPSFIGPGPDCSMYSIFSYISPPRLPKCRYIDRPNTLSIWLGVRLSKFNILLHLMWHEKRKFLRFSANSSVPNLFFGAVRRLHCFYIRTSCTSAVPTWPTFLLPFQFDLRVESLECVELALSICWCVKNVGGSGCLGIGRICTNQEAGRTIM